MLLRLRDFWGRSSQQRLPDTVIEVKKFIKRALQLGGKVIDMKKYLGAADILLPDFKSVSGEKWAVVACDQYTSEPKYWEDAAKTVGESPSTLKMILPEVYLSETEERVPKINAEMEKYLKEVLISHKDSMIFLERTQRDGVVRRGIMGIIDLEEYDYNKGSSSLIRATEGTVLSRIPPRVRIRRGAPIELPHVMLLIDDPEKTVIEPLAEKSGELDTAYDFDLMCGGGHAKGYFIPAADRERINEALTALIAPEKMAERYGNADFAPLLFAVGDGNHSLATAKACYEELKEKLGEAAKASPARYALAEIVNLHDDAIQFEPIYRVIFGVDPEDVTTELKKYASGLSGTSDAQRIHIISKNAEEMLDIEHPEAQLTVGTLQSFIDKYLETHGGAEVDYIHGEDSLTALAKSDSAIGFIFGGMKKDQLFKTVLCDGALPRKTFSMGHAHDKRYYLECRAIR